MITLLRKFARLTFGAYAFWCGLFAALVPVFAEHLPVRVFTTADGLGSSAVTQILRDSRSFLWFATRDGLSRFVTYHSPDVANPNIIQILERQNGDYLVSPQAGGEAVAFTPADGLSGKIALK